MSKSTRKRSIVKNTTPTRLSNIVETSSNSSSSPINTTSKTTKSKSSLSTSKVTNSIPTTMITSKLSTTNRKHLPLWILPIIILTSCSLLYGTWYILKQQLDQDPLMNNLSSNITLPTSIKGAAEVAETLQKIAEAHMSIVYCIFVLALTMKHAFTIPGSSALNVLAGAMFGTIIGTITCTILTGVGASLAYLLSYEFATPLIEKYPSLINRLLSLRKRVEIEKHTGTLPFFLLSFRILPFGPQWAFNLLCPHALVPLTLFAWTTALGQLPYIIHRRVLWLIRLHPVP